MKHQTFSYNRHSSCTVSSQTHSSPSIPDHAHHKWTRHNLHTDQDGPVTTYIRTRHNLHTDQSQPTYGPGTTYIRTRHNLHTDQAQPTYGPGTTYIRTRHNLHTDQAQSTYGPGTTYIWTRHNLHTTYINLTHINTFKAFQCCMNNVHQHFPIYELYIIS